MKLSTSILALLISFAWLQACHAQPHPNVKQRDSKQFLKLAQKTEKVQLLDVRTPQEYQGGYIDGASNINVLEGQAFKEAVSSLDKSKKVAVYCRSGKRSMKAANILAEMGFKKIYNLDGGMLQWEEDGMPVTQ